MQARAQCHVMADMPMAKSANSFVTLATASRWLRELCDFMGGARFAQHLLYVRGDFTITKYVAPPPHSPLMPYPCIRLCCDVVSNR